MLSVLKWCRASHKIVCQSVMCSASPCTVCAETASESGSKQCEIGDASLTKLLIQEVKSALLMNSIETVMQRLWPLMRVGLLNCRRKKHIVIDLPQELGNLVAVYLSRNGPFNTICTTFNTARSYMFYDSKGRPMTSSQHMTLYWQHLLRAMEAPFNFPPHR